MNTKVLGIEIAIGSIQSLNWCSYPTLFWELEKNICEYFFSVNGRSLIILAPIFKTHQDGYGSMLVILYKTI